jgi:D-alanine-D-alanine ligase
MKIGLTYDLREQYLDQGYSLEETAEFDRKETIEALETALRNLGFQTDLIGNAYCLIERLARGARWDLIFNIAEGLNGVAREAQVPAILDLYRIPYTFSDPLALALCLHKGLTKRVIRDLKLPTADFALIETPADIERITLPFPLFAKPVAEGTSKGISASSKITHPDQLKEVCLDLLSKFHQPVLVETFLPGREFTVGIIGTSVQAQVVGMMEISLQPTVTDDFYSFDTKADYEKKVRYQPVDEATFNLCQPIALTAWRGLGCRDAGRIDLRMDARGIPNFIEVNPLAGLNPVHSDLPILSRFYGVEYQELIKKILDSALARF